MSNPLYRQHRIQQLERELISACLQWHDAQRAMQREARNNRPIVTGTADAAGARRFKQWLVTYEKFTDVVRDKQCAVDMLIKELAKWQ